MPWSTQGSASCTWIAHERLAEPGHAEAAGLHPLLSDRMWEVCQQTTPHCCCKPAVCASCPTSCCQIRIHLSRQYLQDPPPQPGNLQVEGCEHNGQQATSSPNDDGGADGSNVVGQLRLHLQDIAKGLQGLGKLPLGFRVQVEEL